MKKIKLLSSMLAVVMVLSVIFAMPVGATKSFSDIVYFNDFDHREATASGVWEQHADMKNNEGLDMRNAGTAVTAQPGMHMFVDTNSEHGIGVTFTQNSACHLYIPMPTAPLTAGKVRIEFSYKGGDWGTVRGFFKSHAHGTNDRGTPMVRLAKTELGVLKGSTNDVKTRSELTTGTWYKVTIEIDIDADTWTLYKDGTLVDSYTYTTGITNFYGISFYYDQTNYPNKGVIGDIKITAFELSDLDITKADGSEISVGNTGNDGLKIEVTADVLSAFAEKDVTVIYALYNDDELVDAKAEVVAVPKSGLSKEFTTKANVTYDSVKAFIWDGLTTMTPLTVAKSYPAE